MSIPAFTNKPLYTLSFLAALCHPLCQIMQYEHVHIQRQYKQFRSITCKQFRIMTFQQFQTIPSTSWTIYCFLNAGWSRQEHTPETYSERKGQNKKDMASGLYVLRVRIDVFLFCVVLCGVHRNSEIKEKYIKVCLVCSVPLNWRCLVLYCSAQWCTGRWKRKQTGRKFVVRIRLTVTCSCLMHVWS